MKDKWKDLDLLISLSVRDKQFECKNTKKVYMTSPFP